MWYTKMYFSEKRDRPHSRSRILCLWRINCYTGQQHLKYPQNCPRIVLKNLAFGEFSEPQKLAFSASQLHIGPSANFFRRIIRSIRKFALFLKFQMLLP